MDGFTLTEMTDIIGMLDRLSAAETRKLHRQLKGLVSPHGLLRASGTRGTGEKAPAIFPLHELAKARVMTLLFAYGMEAKALRTLFNISDLREAPNEMRFASGLENAIAAALQGVNSVAHLEILNGDSELRGHFEYEEDAPVPEDVERITASHDAATGTKVVSRLSLSLAEMLAPLRSMVGEIAKGEALSITQLNPPRVDSE